jgi:hypothetical protein
MSLLSEPINTIHCIKPDKADREKLCSIQKFQLTFEKSALRTTRPRLSANHQYQCYDCGTDCFFIFLTKFPSSMVISVVLLKFLWGMQFPALKEQTLLFLLYLLAVSLILDLCALA